jgi:hypothetical protein
VTVAAGTRPGPYEIATELVEGATGEVWRPISYTCMLWVM